MKRTVKTIKTKIISILLTIISVFTIFSPSLTASASSVQAHSSALDDLSRDPNFNTEDYPDNPTDYSLQVIQIGEGANGELFIYVYQPSNDTKDLRAKFINMSLQHYESKNPAYNLYSLTWLSSNGVFDKYVVNDFTVSSDLERYYNIATIYRPYDASLGDAQAEALDDTNTYKGYEVGICFSAEYYNDTLVYDARKVDVVYAEIVSVGTIRYSNGLFLSGLDKCDSHFMAFRIEGYDATKIYDADIIYTIYDWSRKTGVGFSGEIEETEGTRQTVSEKITEYDKGSNSGGGLFDYQYEWKRIQTINEFNTMLEDNTNQKLDYNESEMQLAEFVFLFKETDYSLTATTGLTVERGSFVTDEGILRLHFATDKGTYNLGVVGDLVTDDGKPDFDVDTLDNIQNTVEDILENERINFEKMIAIILVVLLIILVFMYGMPIVIPLIKLIMNGVGLLFGAILEIITYPFRLIFKNAFK